MKGLWLWLLFELIHSTFSLQNVFIEKIEGNDMILYLHHDESIEKRIYPAFPQLSKDRLEYKGSVEEFGVLFDGTRLSTSPIESTWRLGSSKSTCLGSINEYGSHSPQIGWASDGFPIYGPNGREGEMKPCRLDHPWNNTACLDSCGGIEENNPSIDLFPYRYYLTKEVLQCGSMVHEKSKFDDSSCLSLPSYCHMGCCPIGTACSSSIRACAESSSFHHVHKMVIRSCLTHPQRRLLEEDTVSPSPEPTLSPSDVDSPQPSMSPSIQPSLISTSLPSYVPSLTPSLLPTYEPTSSPTISPTSIPTSMPSSPTSSPSSPPTHPPTSFPSSNPSPCPTSFPTISPSHLPTGCPTSLPSAVPSSSQPTSLPSSLPSGLPTTPTSTPTSYPSSNPTSQPSSWPSSLPTANPSSVPSALPSSLPSVTYSPTDTPSISQYPTSTPSSMPSSSCPTSHPSSSEPSSLPSGLPSSLPSGDPSSTPTTFPSSSPSSHPTQNPTIIYKLDCNGRDCHSEIQTFLLYYLPLIFAFIFVIALVLRFSKNFKGIQKIQKRIRFPLRKGGGSSYLDMDDEEDQHHADLSNLDFLSAGARGGNEKKKTPEDPFNFGRRGESKSYTPLFSPERKRNSIITQESRSGDISTPQSTPRPNPNQSSEEFEFADFAEFVTVGFDT